MERLQPVNGGAASPSTDRHQQDNVPQEQVEAIAPPRDAIGRLAAAVASALVRSGEHRDALEEKGYVPACNDWHLMHALNAYHVTQALSKGGALAGVSIPLVNLAGLLYEVKAVMLSDAKAGIPYELSKQGQSLADWLWDTPGDLYANLLGSLVGAGNGDVMALVRATQSLPGPDHSCFDGFSNPRGGGGVLGPPHKPGGPNGLPPDLRGSRLAKHGVRDMARGTARVCTAPVAAIKAGRPIAALGALCGDSISGMGEILCGITQVSNAALGAVIGQQEPGSLPK